MLNRIAWPAVARSRIQYTHSRFLVCLRDMVDTRRSAGAAQPPSVTLAQAIVNLQAASPSSSSAVSSKHAAVLVPLFESGGEIHVILTQRSAKLPTHPGEVCLPGGKREPGDADDISTAIREAQEELGIDPGCVDVVTTMHPVLSKHLLSVAPVVATVPAALELQPNPKEVEAVFTAPLIMFLASGPGYSYKDVRWEDCKYRLHYFDYEYQGRNFVIWGLTAGMLIIVAEKAFGKKAEFAVHPPGSKPYTALAYEDGKLIFRGSRDVDTSSAAVEGAIVTEKEAEAAVGGNP